MHLLAIVQAHHNNILSKHIFFRSRTFERRNVHPYFVGYFICPLINGSCIDICSYFSLQWLIVVCLFPLHMASFSNVLLFFCVCIGQDWMIEMRVPKISSNKTTHFMFMSSCVFLCFTKTFVPFFYIFG